MIQIGFSDQVKNDINVKPSKNKHQKSEENITTAVRISTQYYEVLRERAFLEKTSVRQLVDDRLAEKLD